MDKNFFDLHIWSETHTTYSQVNHQSVLHRTKRVIRTDIIYLQCTVVYFLACVMAFSIVDKNSLTIRECYLICHNVSMQQNSTTIWSNLLRSANQYGFADPTNMPYVMCLQEAANETCCTPIRSRDPVLLGLLIRLCDSYFDTSENKI